MSWAQLVGQQNSLALPAYIGQASPWRISSRLQLSLSSPGSCSAWAGGEAERGTRRWAVVAMLSP